MRTRKTLGAHSALALLSLAIGHANAATTTQEQLAAKEVRADKAAEKTLAKMTQEEKLAYIGGIGGWDVKPLSQYGIPQIHGADGGAGIRYTSEGNDPGVVYPSGPNLAATFNPRRAIDFGRALGYDTATGGYQFVTGPGMNLYRMPWSGRAFEYLSGEDPFLGASLGPAVINGIQQRRVWAEAKHYAGNDQETNRFILNQVMPERVLREMTLPPFESATKNGTVAMMMCSFQKVNGEYACENKHLIADILKKEWGFKGLVQSDYNAIVHGLPAAQAGSDLDMMGGQMNSSVLKPYLDSGELDMATIDDKVRRILKNIYLYQFDKFAPLTAHNMNSATSNKVALNIAREGIVLLKNQNDVLPLDKSKVKRIAVVGDLAKYAPPTGFGSAHVDATRYVSELSGLQQMAPGAKVEFLDGLSLDPTASTWTTTDSKGNAVAGLKTEFFTNANWSGDPSATRIDTHVDMDWSTDDLPSNGDTANTSIRWSGQMTPVTSGEQVFKVRADGPYKLWVNDELVLQSDGVPYSSDVVNALVTSGKTSSLKAGKAYSVKLEYQRIQGNFIPALGGLTGVQMSWAALKPPADLANYDAVVIATGSTSENEGEGSDHGFDLPDQQADLISAVAKVNPNTIVVMHGGGIANMQPWAKKVGATLQAWFPGQQGGQALAEILYGKVNPSGKLPVTIDKQIEDNASYASYPDPSQYRGDNALTEMTYKEGLYLGYRAYDKNHTKPLYPFGFGLSYTTYSYGDLKLSSNVLTPGATVNVKFTVTNTGDKAGYEVAQLYVQPVKPTVDRPEKELKGFTKVYLKPGESKTVSIPLDSRSLAYYVDSTDSWNVDAGKFKIRVGTHSGDLALSQTLTTLYPEQLTTRDSNPLPAPLRKAVQVSAAQAY